MFDTLFKSKLFPVLLQVITFSVFILLIIIGWGVSSDDLEFLKILRNTNLANLIVWSFWWPGIIITSILFGRLWCMVCPMELMASLLNRVSLKRKPFRFLRTGWVITFLFSVVVVIGVHTFAIHRVPHRMSLYMLILFGLTIIFSLIFAKRAFCSYVCPVGHLLGLYSTIALMELRVKDRSVCDSCAEKPCISKKRNYKWYGRACQSSLFPGSLKDNRDCILCTQCMKVCPNNNVTFHCRKLLKDLSKGLILSTPQVVFILIVFGFAFYEVTTEWKTSGEMLLAPFNAFSAFLCIPYPWSGTVTALLLFLVIPFMVFLTVSALQSLVNRKRKRISSIGTYLVAFIPLIAFTHFAKSILKSVSRFQYIHGALKEPSGIKTAMAIHDGALQVGRQRQNYLNSMGQGLSLIVLIGGLIAAIVLLARIGVKERETFPFFYILLALMYSICVAGSVAAKMFL